MFWDRAVTVTISKPGEPGIRFDERFRIAFKVDMDETTAGNQVSCEIYGLNESSRKQIRQAGNLIQIEAGYRGRTELLTIAEITRVTTRKALPEVITVIEADDGGPTLAAIRVSLSFAGGYTVRDAVDKIAGAAGLSVRMASGVDLSARYSQGSAFSGTVRRGLDQYLARTDARWEIQGGEIVIRAKDGPLDQTLVRLTPQTGLLGAPESLEEEGEAAYTVESFLQPRLRPGVLVDLESRDASGQFVCRRVSHGGDTRANEWASIAEVVQ